MNTIHGHSILDILSEKPLSKTELQARLIKDFGEGVEFHTCQSEGLSFEEIFQFFISKSKIVVIDDKFASNRENTCH